MGFIKQSCMRNFFLFGLLLLLADCRPDKMIDSLTAFPESENLLIKWQILDDAVNRDNLRTQIISIVNNDSIDFPDQGWTLFYSQLPAALYLDPSDQFMVSISNLGGDYYKVEPGEAFPGIPPGESFDIKYRMPLDLIKTTHYPHGYYFTIGNEEGQQIVPVINYQYDPIPKSFTHFGKHDRSVFISAAQRYDQNNDLRSIPVNELIPIIPTPRKYEKKAGIYVLQSNVKVHYDQGLRNEADFLAGTLNQILHQPVLTNPSDSNQAGAIFLRMDPVGLVDLGAGSYILNIDPGNGVEITGFNPEGVFNGIQSFRMLLPAHMLNTPSEQLSLSALRIEDVPRFPYRGLHLDLARNYHEPVLIRKIIDLMALYKLNRLHLHLTDDEGWRLEIPGLSELTQVGARRGHYNPADPTLPPAYGSGPEPDAASKGSGYLSRNDFISLLQFANQRHIEVIPEINGPGHARAAIKAMEVRYERLRRQGRDAEAREYLLHDLNDTSKYTSAQNYHDNVMCVCHEYTYTFLDKVVGEIVNMYREAGASLTTIHIGGDEVPAGSWQGSPECARFIREEPTVSSVEVLHQYFIRRFNTILVNHGLLTAGWEEIALKESEDASIGVEPNPEFLGKGVIPYVWNSLIGEQGEDRGYRLANAGFQIVMCNASNFYFDLAYTHEPEEPGLYWGGLVDTRNAFEMTPFNLFKTVFSDEEGNPLDGQALGKEKVALKTEARRNILGIQGQLWSETLKDPNMVEYYLIPKFFGLVERAWSDIPLWMSYDSPALVKRSLDAEWSKFANRIGKIEMPRLDLLNGGYYYRIPPPGAKVENNLLHANIAFPGLQIRYTLDGSDPNPYSELFTKPVTVDAGQTIKLRAFNSRKRASRLVEVN